MKKGAKYPHLKTKEYYAWAGMKKRCKDLNNKNYGGRGIFYCSSWERFSQFIKDMGEAPSKSHSIERLDGKLGYTKENCIWATIKKQNRNTSRNNLITFDGRTLCLAEWAEVSVVSYGTLKTRLKRGWPIREALSVRKNGRYLKNT